MIKKIQCGQCSSIPKSSDSYTPVLFRELKTYSVSDQCNLIPEAIDSYEPILFRESKSYSMTV